MKIINDGVFISIGEIESQLEVLNNMLQKETSTAGKIDIEAKIAEYKELHKFYTKNSKKSNRGTVDRNYLVSLEEIQGNSSPIIDIKFFKQYESFQSEDKVLTLFFANGKYCILDMWYYEYDDNYVYSLGFSTREPDMLTKLHLNLITNKEYDSWKKENARSSFAQNLEYEWRKYIDLKNKFNRFGRELDRDIWINEELKKYDAKNGG